MEEKWRKVMETGMRYIERMGGGANERGGG